MPRDPIQILAPDGTLRGESPLDVDEVRRLYRAMVSARVYDHKASAMQRQGRLATYAQFEGQEACQIGSVAPLLPQDWVVGTYRDAGAMWFHGYTWRNLILGRTGDERGGAAPDGVKVMPPSITVGGHMIHAVGLGWAERLQGSDGVALTLFGDGATSEGDFHEAMNFAAVFATPTVFFCQNNGWAISMPRDRQTLSDTIAQKADGYGMEGVLVDGNDLLGVYAVTSEAVTKARRGGGPTLIEGLTYRMGPHTTTDDAGRYRSEDSVGEWAEKDPLARVRLFLDSQGAWDETWQHEIEETEAHLVEEAVAAAEAVAPLAAGETFEAMYAEPTAQLVEQRSEAERD
jgi:pyruvate dehydrogenase E1 component alpha subunit